MAAPAGSRWLRLALALAATTTLLTGVTAAYLRQGANEVTVDAAVEAFRASVTTTAAPKADGSPAAQMTATTAPASPATEDTPSPNVVSPASPPSTVQSKAASPAARASAAPAPAPRVRRAVEEGVYTYATEGYEETNALGGSRHDYPAETPMTIRNASCGGWTQRWEPLRERWDESLLCAENDGNAFSVRRFTTYHEFFQRGQQQEFTCPEGSHVSRLDAPPGTTWTWRCTAGSSAIESKVTVIGTEPVDVGGTTVHAIHMHYASTMSGGNRGTQDQHRWLHPDSGLNVKIATDIDTEADSPFGAVHYVERYTITLTSLTPRR
jgi:hypothetical protein